MQGRGGSRVRVRDSSVKPSPLEKKNQEGRRWDALARCREKCSPLLLPLALSLPGEEQEWVIPYCTHHSPALTPTERMWDSQATVWVCHWDCRRRDGGGAIGVWRCSWILGRTPWHRKDNSQVQTERTWHMRLLEITRLQKKKKISSI